MRRSLGSAAALVLLGAALGAGARWLSTEAPPQARVEVPPASEVHEERRARAAERAPLEPDVERAVRAALEPGKGDEDDPLAEEKARLAAAVAAYRSGVLAPPHVPSEAMPEAAPETPRPPAPPPLRVLCCDEDGTPRPGALVVARVPEGGDIDRERTRADGRAELRIEELKEGTGGWSRQRAFQLFVAEEAREPYLVPGAVPSSGDLVVRIPPPGVLVVRISAAVSAALGPRRLLALAPRGADPPSRYGDFQRATLDAGRERRFVLGPVAAGSYDLWTYVPTGNVSDNGVSPATCVPVEVRAGITEHALEAPRTRAVVLATPQYGAYVYLARLDPADGTLTPDEHCVGSDDRCPIAHLPDRPFVAAYVQNGRRLVSAFALLPAGVSGEVVMRTSAPGMATLVTRGNSYSARSCPRGAQVAGPLRAGDVIVAVDGAPLADALRPFGERLPPPGAPPLRLSLRRAGAALEVALERADLEVLLERAYGPFLVPVPAP